MRLSTLDPGGLPVNADLQNVLLGLVSAAVAALFARLIDLFRKHRKRIETARKHPIAGTYRSTYTDVMDGVTRTIRDSVHITQFGLDFSGYSQNLETGRQFRLEGKIVYEKYLAGTYGGERREDESSGVFYLALDLLNTGYVKGLWAGYGAEAGSVISGEWTWRKVAETTIYECSSPIDPLLSPATALLNDALGSGFVKVEDMKELCSSSDGIVLLTTGETGGLEGVGTAEVMDESAKEALEQRLVAAGVRRPNLVGTEVGLLRSAAVIPARRGQGIGLRLVNERLSRLKKAGCVTAMVLAWDSGDAHSSLGVLQAAGFQRVVDIPAFWREPEGQETFDCIRCGRPCTCTAVVMRRTLYDFAETAVPSPRRGRRRNHAQT